MLVLSKIAVPLRLHNGTLMNKLTIQIRALATNCMLNLFISGHGRNAQIVCQEETGPEQQFFSIEWRFPGGSASLMVAPSPYYH